MSNSSLFNDIPYDFCMSQEEESLLKNQILEFKMKTLTLRTCVMTKFIKAVRVSKSYMSNHHFDNINMFTDSMLGYGPMTSIWHNSITRHGIIRSFARTQQKLKED